MRIQHFFIQEYRVLRTLNLSIEQKKQGETQDTYRLDLIVGVNGTGKSTLLKLLAELFQLLGNDRRPDFTFSIQYLLNEGSQRPLVISISNLDMDKRKILESVYGAAEQDVTREKRLYLRVLDERTGNVIEEKLVEAIERKYLPANIIALTSGSEQGWELKYIVDINSVQSGQQLPRKNDLGFEQQLAQWYQREQATRGTSTKAAVRSETSSSLLFIKQRQLPLVILCGLLADLREREPILKDVLKETKVKALSSFSLRFQYIDSDIEPDDRPIVQELMQQSSYAIKQRNTLLLVFHLMNEDRVSKEDIQRITKVFDIMGNGLELFKRLNRFMFPEEGRKAVLSEVNLFFDRNYTPEQQHSGQAGQRFTPQDLPPLHLLEWFSDGEMSFLGRFCLFSLLRESEALVLLDEPEVHFNDYWKRHLVNKIDLALQGKYSHVLMSTHSSITLSDVQNTNIWVMQRNGVFTEYMAPPSLRTLGTDPSDIIVHIFGAESATGTQSIAYLQRRIQEITALNDIDVKRNELQMLLKRVGPSPWRFLIRRELHMLEDIQN